MATVPRVILGDAGNRASPITIAAVFGGAIRAGEALGSLRCSGITPWHAAVLTRGGLAPVCTGRRPAWRVAAAVVLCAVFGALGGGAVVWESLLAAESSGAALATGGALATAGRVAAIGALCFGFMGLLGSLCAAGVGHGADHTGPHPGEALLIVDIDTPVQAAVALATLRRYGGSAVAAAWVSPAQPPGSEGAAEGGRQRGLRPPGA